jgi:hypothetical protein
LFPLNAAAARHHEMLHHCGFSPGEGGEAGSEMLVTALGEPVKITQATGFANMWRSGGASAPKARRAPGRRSNDAAGYAAFARITSFHV